MYMPKSAVPLQQSPQPTAQPQTGYMPKTAIPVQPEKTPTGLGYWGGLVKNIPKSFGDTIGGVAKAAVNVFNPDWDNNTLYNIGKLATGVAQKFTPGVQKEEEVANQVGKFYKDRYGGVENIKNTLYNDPVGVGLDVASVVSGVGAGVKGAGLVSRVPNLVKAGSTLSKVGTAIDPLAQAGKVTGRVVGGATRSIGKTAERVAENLPLSGVGNPNIQKQIKAISGRTPYELFDKYDLWDLKPESAQKAINDLDTMRAGVLKGKNLGVKDVLSSLDDGINSLEGDISDSAKIQRDYLSRKKQQLLDSLVETGEPFSWKENAGTAAPVEMSANVGFSNINQPVDKFIKLKQQIAKDVPDSKWMVGSADSAKASAAKDMYRVLKDKINSLDDSLKQSGLDESALIQVKDLFEKYAAREGAKSAISLIDVIIGGATFGAKGLPPAIAAILARKAITSPKAIQLFSKGIKSASNAEKGSKYITPVVRKTYEAGKIGRLFSPSQNQSKSEEDQLQFRKVSPQPYNPIIQPSTAPYQVPKIRRPNGR